MLSFFGSHAALMKACGTPTRWLPMNNVSRSRNIGKANTLTESYNRAAERQKDSVFFHAPRLRVGACGATFARSKVLRIVRRS